MKAAANRDAANRTRIVRVEAHGAHALLRRDVTDINVLRAAATVRGDVRVQLDGAVTPLRPDTIRGEAVDRVVRADAGVLLDPEARTADALDPREEQVLATLH